MGFLRTIVLVIVGVLLLRGISMVFGHTMQIPLVDPLLHHIFSFFGAVAAGLRGLFRL